MIGKKMFGTPSRASPVQHSLVEPQFLQELPDGILGEVLGMVRCQHVLQELPHVAALGQHVTRLTADVLRHQAVGTHQCGCYLLQDGVVGCAVAHDLRHRLGPDHVGGDEVQCAAHALVLGLLLRLYSKKTKESRGCISFNR